MISLIHWYTLPLTETHMAKIGAYLHENILYDLQELIDNSDIVGNWDWNIPRDCFTTNLVVALLFNVNPRLALNGAPIAVYMEGIHAENRTQVTENIGKHAKNGLPYVAEYRVHSADGIIRWVLARGRFELDHAGRPARGRGIFVDITSSKTDQDISFVEPLAPLGHPLERIADLCLTIREESEALQDALVRQLANMLLLEAGRGLDKLEAVERRRRVN